MKIITEPTVTIVAFTKFLPTARFEIPDDGDDNTKLGAFAAKVCYDSVGKEGRANEANQLTIMEHRHGSVLEHSSVSLFIEGVTRGLTLELNRHRTFAISQRSTRYTKEEDSAIVLEPYYAQLYKKYHLEDPSNMSNLITDEPELELISDFIISCEQAIRDYQYQVETLMKINPNNLEGFELRKWARGKARNLLPHALETRGTWTNNHRGWRWFIEARSDIHAEPEIRRLAHHVLIALQTVAPLQYKDFQMVAVHDDIPVWRPLYSKV